VFDISPDKLLVVLILASVVLGPSRLQEVARGLARARNELRRLTSGLDPGAQKLLRDPGAAVVEALAEPFHADERPGGPG
jgi:Sec-independent protein translocase protein TatA